VTLTGDEQRRCRRRKESRDRMVAGRARKILRCEQADNRQRSGMRPRETLPCWNVRLRRRDGFAEKPDPKPHETLSGGISDDLRAPTAQSSNHPHRGTGPTMDVNAKVTRFKLSGQAAHHRAVGRVSRRPRRQQGPGNPPCALQLFATDLHLRKSGPNSQPSSARWRDVGPTRARNCSTAAVLAC
jgi:hypothetical protein